MYCAYSEDGYLWVGTAAYSEDGYLWVGTDAYSEDGYLCVGLPPIVRTATCGWEAAALYVVLLLD